MWAEPRGARTVWLKDIARDFKAMNGVWNAWVDQESKPVRATVQLMHLQLQVQRVRQNLWICPPRLPLRARPLACPRVCVYALILIII